MAVRRYYRQIDVSTNKQGKKFVMCDDCFKIVHPKKGVRLQDIDGLVAPYETCHFCKPETTPPIARNTDPATSHQAADRYNRSKRGERQRQVLLIVDKYPELTNGEYARRMLEHYPQLPVKIAVETPHKRLSDLQSKGWVVVTGERKCSDSGYNCQTWKITALGLAQL